MRLSERFIYKRALEAILSEDPSESDIIAAMHIAKEALDLGKSGNIYPSDLPEWGNI